VLDYVVTYGGPSIFMTAVFVVVLPLVYFKFARPRYARWPPRLAVLLAVWICAFVIAYGDVYLIARDAKRLCEQEAGLKVYRTVEAEGFAGVSDIEFWAEKGFSYLETVESSGRQWRHQVLNGKPTSEEVSSLASELELVHHSEPVDLRIAREKESLVFRSSGEVAAELLSFRIFPGFWDRLFVRGSGWTPPMCEGPAVKSIYERSLTYKDLIFAALKPKKKIAMIR